MNPELLTPKNWKDYELIDCGNYEKLERFGNYVTARPEPQAIWNRSLPAAEWERLADAVFSREKRGDNNGEKGEWICRRPIPRDGWFVNYKYNSISLRMRLGLTAFKHVGIFPEQAENWNYIYDKCVAAGGGARVLNLFAYTGGASLAAKAAGADVTHVDSVKQVVSWSRENMEASSLSDIRWVVEDAMKFVKREVKRGKKYDGIILDPPAYGRGPEGEKWVLEENINELLTDCAALVAESGAFIVLNLYSMGLSALLARTAIVQIFGPPREEQFGELYLEDRSGKALPLGVYFRGMVGR